MSRIGRPGRPIRDSDRYSSLLGPHAATLERRTKKLVRRMMGRRQDWYAAQREMVDHDPYQELHEIGVRAERRQLEYASERVAVARAAARLPASEGEASSPSQAPDEMLERYEKDLGRQRARRIDAESSVRFLEVTQYEDSESVRTRLRQLSDPYPSSEQLDQEVACWVEDSLESAATLAALTQAERETFRRDSQVMMRVGFEL